MMKPKAMQVKLTLSEAGLYGKRGFIKNCVEEDGGFYYYIKVKGERGLIRLADDCFEIL